MRGAAPLILFAGLGLGCSHPDPRPFLGTFHLEGKLTAVVGEGKARHAFGGSTDLPYAGYSVVIRKGTNFDLESVDSRGCTLGWSLSAKAAHLEGGQSCEIPTRQGMAFLTLEACEVTLSPTGAGRLTVAGHAVGMVEQGGLLAGRLQPATGDIEGTLEPALAGP